jgi:hypothetical protein
MTDNTPIPPNIENLIGQRFGRLTVSAYAGLTANRKTRWLCLCDCGGEKITTRSSLKAGRCSSCGCLAADGNRSRAASQTIYACPFGLTPEGQRDKLWELYYREGMTLKEIGAAAMALAGWSHPPSSATVGRWLDAAGIGRRSQGHAQRLWAKNHPEESRRVIAIARSQQGEGIERYRRSSSNVARLKRLQQRSLQAARAAQSKMAASKRITKPCDWCGEPIVRRPCEIARSRYHYCSRSCAVRGMHFLRKHPEEEEDTE